MSNKITAHFGADVSEVERKMMQATRATKAYERAVTAMNGKKGPVDMTQQLGKANGQLAKGMMLLRGGAVGMGIGLVLRQMQSFSNHAKELGDNATEAQKSAAKWGEEFAAFGNSVKSAGASVLGTLAGWGRSIGDKFRSPLERSNDAVAESSEKAAARQEAALAKLRDAHAKAAAEIPKLQAALQGEQRETRLSVLSAEGRAMTELFETQKALAELEKKPRNAVTEAERLRLLVELEKRQRKFDELVRNDSARVADEDKKRDQEAAAREKKRIDDAANIEQKAGEEIAEIREERAWQNMSAEERMADTIQKGREALARYEKDKSNENLLAVERLRDKYEEVKEEAERAAEATSKIGEEARKQAGDALKSEMDAAGLTVGEDGKIRRGKRVVSEADAARAIKTRRKTEEQTAQSRRGQIGGAASETLGKDGDGKAVNVLERIERLLTPSE